MRSEHAPRRAGDLRAPPRVSLRSFDGAPLEVARYLAAAPAEQLSNGVGMGDTATSIQAGADLHESILRVTAQWASKGMDRDALRAAAVALLDTARSARGNERVNKFIGSGELDRIIAGAVSKFAIAKVARSFDPAPAPPDPSDARPDVSVHDFYAYMPTHSYLFVPTRELWPAASVDSRLPWPTVKTPKGDLQVRPSAWLDKHRPIEQMTWHPGMPALVRDQVVLVSGWASHPGAAVFNLYRAPNPSRGDPKKAGPWRDHLRRVYPAEAGHIERWLAHRVQRPGYKCNHALVLGGSQGIGKDTLLEPIKAAVGAWNWSDVSPTQMLGRFNGWAKAVVVRINEASDLGELDRFAFYDHSKVYIASPPDVLRVDEKHLREHYVANVCGVIITTNHKTDGIYLTADDRRHFVAWSEAAREDFASDYWTRLYGWYGHGGDGHVAAYLNALDLSGFDPKAPPVKTPAFWAVVQAGEAPESSELRDVVESMGSPSAITIDQLAQAAYDMQLYDLSSDLRDRKARRQIPHKLERVGYGMVRNPDAQDGAFKVCGMRKTVYARGVLSLSEQIRAARLIG